MKTYGANKATEFSRKQISVIYGMAKRAELKVEKWVMSELYDLADYYGFDDNGTVERAEFKIIAILSDIFSGNVTEAQAKIDEYTTSEFEAMGKKAQSRANRELIA